MDSCKRKQVGDSESKSKKRTQCYREEYTVKYPFVKPCSDPSRVLCEICQTEFGIKYGGLDDIRRHVEEARHEKNFKTKELAKKSQQITEFFARAPTNSVSTLDLDVVRAEVTMVDLCVDLNLPMSSLDKFSKAFRNIFHDSKIAKNFQCARSKGTAIVKEMAALTTLDLADRMKSGCFTLSTDGSNDKGGEKLFPLIIRTIDPKSIEVRSDALSVPAIEGSATGVKIFSLIESEFNAHNIPWENCIAFGSDNANVMVGKDAGVYGCMLKKHSELYLAGCACHLIHIAAEKGGASLPFSPGQLLVDVFYYLEKGSKRQGDLKCCQLLLDIKETKMLKHVATRWLSIGKCLPRLIDSWDALYFFFREEEKSFKQDNNIKRKVGYLKDIFGSKTKKLYCIFLLDAIKDFETINTELQSDKPMIQYLSQRLQALFKSLLIKFVKPGAILGQDLMTVDFTDRKNIKADEELIVGSGAFSFLEEQNMKKEKRDAFYKHVVQFYQASCSYLKKKLPFNDPLLKHITITDPSTQLTSSFTDLHYFLKRFPTILGTASISDIQNEFATYQCTDISHISTDRIDTTWFEIGKLKENGQTLFNHLPRVMLSLLTIPHSSAHCERIFSVVRKNKTDFRGNMSRGTLEALVVAKSRPGDALDRIYTPSQLKELKSAYYRSLQ